MNVRKLLLLVSEAAEGKDNIKEGAVGYYGYGIVFRDIDDITKKMDISYSGGVFPVGTTRKVMQDWDKDRIKEFDDFLRHTPHDDMLLAGAVKTLVPTLEFGGEYEHLFEVWMFIKTPEDRRFPATLHYGKSGLVIGGWDPERASFYINDVDLIPKFPKRFNTIINFSPHDFSEEEKESLAEAFEHALRKVPVSDFYGIYKHDSGNRLMGVKEGRPIIVELGFSPEFSKLDLFLNYTLKLGLEQDEFEKWDFH